MKTSFAPMAAIMLIMGADGTANTASCTLPETMLNGQMADATKIMDNFDAVAGCAENAVTTTGAITAGSIAVLAGSDTIESGDLSGDVTTAGGTATTLSNSGVTAGTYSNANIVVDAKGRVTSAANGTTIAGGAVMGRYTVATAGDSFISVSLDTDNGYAYRVIVKGSPSANATLNFRVSSDNGTSFFSGSSDYKYGSTGSASAISLTNGKTLGSGRNTIAEFTVAGMNVAATEKFAVTGTIFSVDTTPANVTGAIGGHNNALAADNFNAFQVYTSAGNMNDFAAYVVRLY